MSKFEVQSIPETHKRGWTVTIDGIDAEVGLIEIRSGMGKLLFGLRPEGFDGWVFAEEGGGGAVTLPYVFDEHGQLFVALILENRQNMGGERWCVIGGFKDPDETHATAQAREAREEAAIDTTRARLLSGLPANSNRLFFVADPLADEGVHAYAVEFSRRDLESDQRTPGWYTLKPHAQSRINKGDRYVRLMPWREAAKLCADVLGRGAIAQLLAEVF